MLKQGQVRALGIAPDPSGLGLRIAGLWTDGTTIEEIEEGGICVFDADERAAVEGDDEEQAQAALIACAARGLSQQNDAAFVGIDGLGRDCDGAALATLAGRAVVWDLREADQRLGGQGGPIAPAFHFALARALGGEAPVGFLDLADVARLVYCDPRLLRPESDGALAAFDAGPCFFGESGAGEVVDEVLEAFLGDPYFLRYPPKVWPDGLLAGYAALLDELTPPDRDMTLCAAAAMAAVRGFEVCPEAPGHLWVTGRGRHDPMLMAFLEAASEGSVAPIEDAGFDGDDIDALALAHIAVRVARGLPTTFPMTTGVGAAVGGGTLSRP